jgi:hypothetical protein
MLVVVVGYFMIVLAELKKKERLLPQSDLALTG